MSTTKNIETEPARFKNTSLYKFPRIITKQRIVINEQGTVTTAMIAFKHHGMVADVTFVRDDGFALGAPKMYEDIAYEMWKNRWVEFYFGREIFPKPISEYVPT
jgi:hypothetical protein